MNAIMDQAAKTLRDTRRTHVAEVIARRSVATAHADQRDLGSGPSCCTPWMALRLAAIIREWTLPRNAGEQDRTQCDGRV
jgi:hypothetical protein